MIGIYIYILESQREAKPPLKNLKGVRSINNLVFRDYLGGIKRGEAPLKNFFPSPLIKGRGIKGEGLVDNSVFSGRYEGKFCFIIR